MLELFSVRRRKTATRQTFTLGVVGGALTTALGSALAKPQLRGRARDRLTSAFGQTVDLFDKARRDARNRIVGPAAGAFARRTDSSDEKVIARVRSTLGRVVTHPHAIEVRASDGRVVLSGPILEREAHRLLRAVQRVRGVRDLENRLEKHERDEGVPALQGAGRRPRAPELLQEQWTPSLRVGAGLVGSAGVLAAALRFRNSVGMTIAGLGALLVLRATLDKPLGRILGMSTSRRSVEFQKTITIGAPVEEVFAYWADFERFSEFMDHVEQVRVIDGRTHWKVRGPLGSTIEWDAETTSFVPNEVIAWKTIKGSVIKHAGIVRFESVDEGRATRLGVRLAYNPVAGYIGHGIAVLFRVDPKKSLDDDLLRMKSLLEEGKATAHGREVTRVKVPVTRSSNE